jgi:hypothetical protein
LQESTAGFSRAGALDGRQTDVKRLSTLPLGEFSNVVAGVTKMLPQPRTRLDQSATDIFRREDTMSRATADTPTRRPQAIRWRLKAKAVRLVLDEGTSVPSVARSVGSPVDWQQL